MAYALGKQNLFCFAINFAPLSESSLLLSLLLADVATKNHPETAEAQSAEKQNVRRLACFVRRAFVVVAYSSFLV